MVWDLNPTINIVSPLSEADGTSSRPQPTAYVISFPHPLTSVSSHPSSSKEFLVSDCRGSIFLTDWRSEPGENESEGLSPWNSSVLELVEPRALSDTVTGLSTKWSGSVSWRRDSVDM